MLNIKETKNGEIDDIETAINELKIAEGIEAGFSKAKENIEFLENMANEYYSKAS